MNRELDALCARFNGFSLAGWVLLVLMSATSAHAATYTVTNADPSGPGSLFQAIFDADGTPADDVIVFDPSLGDVTITPGSTLGISSSDGGSLRIDGDGRVTVSGGNSRSVLINSSDSFLTINGLTITGGNAANGGGIFNRGTLVLNDSTITGNVATSIGGGILNATLGAELTLNRTVVTNNSAPNAGGIRNESTLVLNNSTVAANSATALGSGIFNFGTLTLNNSTVSGNSPGSPDSGLYVGSGTVAINNSILANNGSGDCVRNAGTINASHSLIESGLGCVNGTNTNNLTGDPALGTLTVSPAYFPLLPTSPAIDAGDNALIPDGITTDQAGDNRIINSTVDMGAVEFQGADLSVTVNDTPDPVEVGERVDYSIEVMNGGPYPATNVILSMTLPAGRSLNLGNIAGWICAPQAGDLVECGFQGDLGPQQSSTLVVWLFVPNDPATLTLSASVESDITDPDESNNTASATTTVATVPAAPLIGTAVAGNAQATIAFLPPASDGGSAITGYTATISPGGLTGSCAGSPCVVNGLTNGTEYTFTVRATNAIGPGPASASSNAVTPATVPDAPIIGTATGGVGQATVAFSPPGFNGGAAISAYTATSDPSGLTGSCAASPCTVTGLVAGTPYSFTVTATNARGTSPASAPSNTIRPAGIVVSPTSLVTGEDGTTDDFTVVLQSEPTLDVTIELVSSDTTEGTVSPTSLVFTAANWDTPQPVTVTGVDDDLADGDVFYPVVTSVNTTDPVYSTLVPNNVAVRNTDNDAAGIVVNPTTGLVTREDGGTDDFTVALQSEPTGDVTIELVSSDTTEGTVSPTSLLFTVANWATPQQVTVTGVDDDVADGEIAYTVLTSATSTDTAFAAIEPDDVAVSNTDDDTAGVVVSPTSGLVVEAGGPPGTFTVVLTSQPTAPVTIPVTSSDPALGSVSPTSLVFTPEDWNMPQTVLVTAGDLVGTLRRPFTISLGAPVSEDPAYTALSADGTPDVSANGLGRAVPVPLLGPGALALMTVLLALMGFTRIQRSTRPVFRR